VTYAELMSRRWIRSVAITAFAVLAGCTNSAICSGDVGPETLTVDASAFAEDPGVEVEVCIVSGGDDPAGRQEFCSPPGTPEVSLTGLSGDYPATLEYYVDLRSGSNHFFPGNGGGTVEMTCTATTTRVVLPLED
jgi:hypothetical protein